MRRPSPSTVLAAAALFLALGGTGVAATLIGTNQIRDRAVTAAKLGRLPAARLQSSTMQLPNGVPANVAFDSTPFTFPGMTDGQRGGLRAPRTGVYAVSGGVRFPADARGIRAIFIAGPQGYLANQEDSANADRTRSTIYAISTLTRLRKGERIVLQAFQETGEPMRLLEDPRTFLAMHFVSP